MGVTSICRAMGQPTLTVRFSSGYGEVRGHLAKVGLRFFVEPELLGTRRGLLTILQERTIIVAPAGTQWNP